jgi:hypothetical protein
VANGMTDNDRCTTTRTRKLIYLIDAKEMREFYWIDLVRKKK